MTTQPWGAIFDWDGVVIDSSKAHEESWERLAKEFRRELPDGHFLKGFGRKNEFIIPELLRWSHDPGEIRKLSARKEALYREIIQERGLAALPGVEHWLGSLATAGIPCAVGSSTQRENIELALEILHLRSFFKAVVTAEDVNAGKPDPEVFLKAADRLGVPACRCVVFEDAFVGIEAAHRGGMKVIAVATTNSIDRLGAADLAVPRLDALSVEQVRALIGQ